MAIIVQQSVDHDMREYAKGDTLIQEKVNELTSSLTQTSYSSAATSANTKLLLSKLKRGASNASILIIGDSTGNGADEWVTLAAQKLATLFASYTVQIRYWNESTGIEYNAPQVIQAGTSSYILDIWNCSVSGQIPGYVQGFRWNTAIVPTNPDLIFISHGHNLGDPTGVVYLEQMGRNTFLSLTEELALQFPLAGIVLIAQNPSTLAGREKWQAIKANTLEQVVSMRGYGFIDVHQAFIDTKNPSAYIGDGTHPNSNGSILWADVVTKAMTDENTSIPTRLNPSSLLVYSKNYLANPEFSSWAGTNPDNWTPNAMTVTSKDTTNYESGLHGCKLTTNATSGTAQLEQGINLASAGLLHLRGKQVTLAVRVFQPASNTVTVRAQIVDNTGSANARSLDVPLSTRDRYVWLFATKILPIDATAIYVRLIPRTSGTNIVDATFDRAYLVQGIIPNVGVI
jgi:hypothetical protein